jgi:MOSC domain-containing protein YiiM
VRVISVNTGLPSEIVWRGNRVSTAICKQSVTGRVALRKSNLDGDRQANLVLHGGVNKAAYAYPIEHYRYWRGEFPGRELPMGIFGENFTTEGLLESSVHIGDRFRIGSSEVVVTQPRLPCFKLGMRFESDDMKERFLQSLCTGFYFAVIREGEVGAGDVIEKIAQDPIAITVSEITRLYIAKTYQEDDLASLQRALCVTALPESWKDDFRARLEKLSM